MGWAVQGRPILEASLLFLVKQLCMIKYFLNQKRKTEKSDIFQTLAQQNKTQMSAGLCSTERTE
jgi:hypothetical protein